MTTLTNRYEVLFLYECRDCNPNGDPLDENRPRTDPETGQATVTDVRIKRTVRDYFLAQEPDANIRLKEGMEVLIRDTAKPDGFLAQSKDRAEQFLTEATKDIKGEKKRTTIEAAILKHCIDARLFGAALPLKKKEPSVQLTGPVQFSAFNRSLHRVVPIMVQQTAAYAGDEKSHQKSFAERWLLPYALIAVHGVVNEAAAQTTRMTVEDLNHLVKALWEGTAGLNTHSKFGHDPLLLVLARYQPGYRLGALSRRVRMADKQAADTALRSTEDYVLDIADLLDAFRNCKTLLDIRVRQDARLRCRAKEAEASFAALAEQAGLPAGAVEG